MLVIRKLVSFIIILFRFLGSRFRKVLFIFLGFSNVKIGSKFCCAKNVIIRAYGNGKVIIGHNVNIEQGVEIIANNGNIVIGDNVFIGRNCQIVAKESIEIQSDSFIASLCIVRDANHLTIRDKLIRNQGFVTKPIFIGRDVWIATQCVIVAGAIINNGCIIGANSLVNIDTVEYGVYVGSPVYFIKSRDC